MRTGDRRLRVIGAIVAAGLSGIAVLIGWWSDASMLLLGGLVGLPTAAILGWRNAPTVRSQPSADRFFAALRMAFVSVLLGDVFVSSALVLGATSQRPEILLGWALISVLGLVLFGLPAFALAFVVLWPWTFVIRRLPRALVG